MVYIYCSDYGLLLLYGQEGLLQTVRVHVHRNEHIPDHMHDFPKRLDLRPTVFPRDNIFTDAVKWLYQTDTSTNVLPSIHVFNSLAAAFAIGHSHALKKKKWVQPAAYVLATLIILSTMFLKQHSVTDVFAAMVMAGVIYPFVYVPSSRKRPAFPTSRCDHDTKGLIPLP